MKGERMNREKAKWIIIGLLFITVYTTCVIGVTAYMMDSHKPVSEGTI